MKDNPLYQIIGQEKIKLVLERIINSGRISHAFLFKGLEGVGKENTALRFAESLIYYSNLDEEKKEYIINKIQNLAEPYIKYIFPLPRGRNENDDDGPYDKLKDDEIEIIHDELFKKIQNPFHKISIPKASNIKINSIRDINRFTSLSYEETLKRLIIISDAHLMNEAAQNALLKNLEEPPGNIIFILCTNYPERLKETIRSRCWEINFQPLEDNEVEKILIKYFTIPNKEAKDVAGFSNGSVNFALRIIDFGLENLMEKTIKILRFSFGKKFHSAYKEFDEMEQPLSSEYLTILIRFLIHWLNDFVRFKYNAGKLHFINYRETFEKFYSKYPDIDIIPLVHKLDGISSRLKNNINLNLAVSNIISEISSIIPER